MKRSGGLERGLPFQGIQTTGDECEIQTNCIPSNWHEVENDLSQPFVPLDLSVVPYASTQLPASIHPPALWNSAAPPMIESLGTHVFETGVGGKEGGVHASTTIQNQQTARSTGNFGLADFKEALKNVCGAERPLARMDRLRSASPPGALPASLASPPQRRQQAD